MRVKILLLVTVIMLFVNSANSQTFTNTAISSGINFQYNGGFNGAGATICDYNNDGFDDIIFPSSFGERIKIYKNNNGQFTDVAFDLGILDAEESKTVLCVDYDNDGDRDIYIANLSGQNKLYRNNGTTFDDVPSAFFDTIVLVGVPQATVTAPKSGTV